MSKSDAYLVQLCSGALERLKLAAVDFHMGAIALADGFPLVNVSCDAVVGRRATAMSAALYGLSASIAKEFKLKAVTSVMLECEFGVVICRQIPGPKRNYILFTVFNQDTNCGIAMWYVKNTAKAISKELFEQSSAS